MRFIVSADLHISNRWVCGRCRLQPTMQVLYDLVKLAEYHKVKHIFLIGDVIDKKHGTPRAVLRALYKFFRKSKFNHDVTLHWIRGNHETPDNSDPHDTLMDLFSEVCHVVIRPGQLTYGDTDLYLLPWYPERDFIRLARGMAITTRSRGQSRRSVLLAHVGIREGKISPSNIHLPQRVSLSHLFPAIFDLIILGDYHASQFVANNAFYVGAPISHIFGDAEWVGPWLVDTESWDVESLVLPTRPPTHRDWILADPGDMYLPGYNADDYNRIYAPAASLAALRALYDGADCRVIDKRVQQPKRDGDVAGEIRTSGVQPPDRLIDRFLNSRGKLRAELNDLRNTGLELVKKVTNDDFHGQQ